MDTPTHTRQKHVLVWQNVHAHVYTSCVRSYAQIFTNFLSFFIKLYKDWSFSCGDICKTILTFVYSLIFSVFWIFSKCDLQSSSKIWKIHRTLYNLQKHNSKYPNIIRKNTIFPQTCKTTIFVREPRFESENVRTIYSDKFTN